MRAKAATLSIHCLGGQVNEIGDEVQRGCGSAGTKGGTGTTGCVMQVSVVCSALVRPLSTVRYDTSRDVS
jgi:hypothetical protein